MGEHADNAVAYFQRSMQRRGDSKAKRPIQIVTCRYCAAGDLRWGQIKGGKWVVKYRDGTSHVCPKMMEDWASSPSPID